MFHTFIKNGKKTAAVNVFIDPQWGFSSPGIPASKGGSLYVPGGEGAAEKMGEIIANTQNGIFIIGQDYHPKNHISFVTNHPGVMQYRIEQYKKFLAQHRQPIPPDAETLYDAAQQPVHFFNSPDQPPVPFPFEEIVLDENDDIIGIKQADGRIRHVEVTTESGNAPSKSDRGRVSRVLDTYLEKTFDDYRAEGIIYHTQTLWTRHCEQGEQSSLYPESMNLPQGLRDKLSGDLKSDVVSYTDPTTGNEFHVIRKGSNSEIDSYGIGIENDMEPLPHSWNLFSELSRRLKKQGVHQVQFNVGGLATNFCTEFSINNIADYLSAPFKTKNIGVEINFVPEISHAIPIPGGAETPFSAEGAPIRMRESRGVGQISIADIIAAGKPGATITGEFSADRAAGVEQTR
ncbi:MAG: hypothetical protein ACKVOE_06360 [Rickettsiales bacterium]